MFSIFSSFQTNNLRCNWVNNRVPGESGTDRHPNVYPAHTLSTCRSLDMRRLGSIRRPLCNGARPSCPGVFVDSSQTGLLDGFMVCCALIEVFLRR